mgnify:CR=1 FL=1
MPTRSIQVTARRTNNSMKHIRNLCELSEDTGCLCWHLNPISFTFWRRFDPFEEGKHASLTARSRSTTKVQPDVVVSFVEHLSRSALFCKNISWLSQCLVVRWIHTCIHSLSLVLSLFFKNIGVLNDGWDMLNRDFRNIWGRLVPARTLFPVFEKTQLG